MRKFNEVEHTADMALAVEGDTLEELFVAALEGMYFLLLDKKVDIPMNSGDTDATDKVKPLLMSAPAIEDLLILWLSDMNYKVDVYHQIMTRIHHLTVTWEKNYCQLEGKFEYRELTEEEMSQLGEIKAPTYHRLEVVKKGNRFVTQIVFDV